MRTWAEIDLTALEHNYRTAGHAAPGMPVSGPLQGQRLWTWGRCDRSYPGAPGSGYAGGGCVSEAEELRQSGVKLPILCLGETPEELIPLLLELDVTQMVEDLETGRRLSAAAQRAGRTLRSM